MVTKRKAKKQFRQAEWDRLVTRRARAILALREARGEVNKYVKTHTRGY
jgi:hypothetical protein